MYRFAEHLFVGLSAGYSLAMGFGNVKTMAIGPISKGNIWLVIPCILGLLMFSGFVPRQGWLRRYPTAFLVGIGTGIAMKGIITTRIISQIRATVAPLNSVSNVVLVLGVLSTLVYFLLSLTNHVGTIGGIAKIGKLAMMISFGVVFATSIFDNFSLLIGTFKTILQWIGFAV